MVIVLMAPSIEGHTSHGSLVALASVTAGVGAALYYYYHSKNKTKETKASLKAAVHSLHIYPIKSCKGISVSRAAVGPTGFLWDRWWMVVDERGRFVTQRQESKMALIEPSISVELAVTDPKDLPPDAVMTVNAPGMDPLKVPLKMPADTKHADAEVWEWEGQALDVGEDAATWFSSYLGRAVRLVRFDLEQAVRRTDEKYAANSRTAFSDGYSYLVASQASLEQLNSKLPEPLLMNRFRPNICVDGCAPFDEDTWKTFVIGTETRRVFHGVKPCGRCKVTTTNQETAEVGVEPLQTLKTFRSGDELCLPKVFKSEVIFGMNAVCDFKPTYFQKLNPVVTVGDTISLLDKSSTLAELTPT